MLVIAFDRGDVEAVLVDKGEAEGPKRANNAQVRAAERRRGGVCLLDLGEFLW
jgi:hypothetical protein